MEGTGLPASVLIAFSTGTDSTTDNLLDEGSNHSLLCFPLHPSGSSTALLAEFQGFSNTFWSTLTKENGSRASRQLSAAMYNQTLPHRDEAMAETREYHRNVAWTQVSWHSQNGTQSSFPVCTKGNASDCLIISKIRQVASWKQLSAIFLHHLGRLMILLFHAWFLSP